MFAVAVIVLPLLILWGGFALWYQIPGGLVVKAIMVVAWAAVGLSLLIVAVKGRPLVALCGHDAVGIVMVKDAKGNVVDNLPRLPKELEQLEFGGKR